MAGFPFKFINGSGTAGVRTPIEREAAWSKRTDNNNFVTLPLEEKAFEGLRATTAQGLAERGWTAALTGQSATTAQGTLGTQKRYYELLDNFTDGNGTGITSHSSDLPQQFGWAAYNYTTEPTIESNRLRGPGATDTARIWCAPYWAPTVAAENDFWLEVSLYRRNTTAGATTGIVNNGVFVRGSAVNGDGFVIGWNELDDDWYILEYVGGTLNQTLGQGFGNGIFGGTSEERKLLIHVYTYGGSPPYYNVQIDVFVDSGSGYSEFADFYGTAYGTTFGGTAYYEVGTVFEETNGVDVDWIRLYDDLPQLEGARLTTASGFVKDHFQPLVGFAATTTAGTLSGGTGSSVEVSLTGEDATTAQGTITPEVGAIIVELTGLAATTAQGALVPTHIVPGEPTFDFNPRVAWTYYTDASDQNPGNIGTQFLPWDGVLYGAGNAGSETTRLLFPRAGLKKISQVTEETYPWTSNFKWTISDNTGMSVDDPTNPFLIGKFFPRGFAGSQDPGPRYNTVYAKGGWITINPGGNLWSAVERVYDKPGSVSVFLAPHPGDIQTDYYDGPELFTGTVQSALVTDPLRQRYQNAAPMGLYALSDSEALGFYPQIIDGQISGKFADLVGNRATLAQGVLGKTYTPGTNIDITLVGFAATTTQGTITNDGPNKYVELAGLDVAATQGVLYARDANVVPAFRRLKNGAWESTPTVASSFTGASRVWVRSHYLTVVPSGYGDIIYAVYYSEGWANVGPKIGVLVMDAATGSITSNTLYDVASTAFTRTSDGDSVFGDSLDMQWRPFGTHRTVALTHKLGSGTHVTQFLFCGQVVHLSWTSGTRTAPTVTVKNGVSLGTTTAIFPAWESLEVRGDKVYHVVPAGSTLFGSTYDGGVGTLYVNDATGAGSTWTTPTLSETTSGTKDTARDLPVFYGGYGGGRKTYWYISWWENDFSITEEGNDSGWFDAWYQQRRPLSVEARAVLGRVGVSVTYDPNVTLTGQVATTAQGTLYADITYQRQLTGLAATTAQGVIVPEGGDVIAALTGLVATTDYGDLTVGAPPTLVDLEGLRATTGYGWLTFSGYKLTGLRAETYIGVIGYYTDESVALTGLALTTSYGVVSTAATASLTGAAATSAQGAVTPANLVPHWKFGLAASLNAGVLTPVIDNTAALVGGVATTTPGTLLGTNDHPRALTGESATTAHGTLTPSQLNAQLIAGAQATARAGVLVPLVSVSATGQMAVSSQGTLQLLLNIFLTGRSGTTSAGLLSPLEEAVVPLTGLRARTDYGWTMLGLPAPRGRDVWVTARPDDDTRLDDDTEEVVVRTPADN